MDDHKSQQAPDRLEIHDASSVVADAVEPLFTVAPNTVLTTDTAARLEYVERLETKAQERYETAVARGQRDGVRDVLLQCVDIVAEMQRKADQLLEESEEDAIRLAVAIAEKILLTQLQLDPALLLRYAKQLRAMMSPGSPVTLSAGPQAHRLLSRSTASLEEAGQTVLVSDESASPWSLRLESPNGTIDAGLESQLRRLAQGLRSSP